MKYLYEKVLTSRNESFVADDEVGKVVDCVFHVHPEFELTYVVSSFGTRFIGDNVSMFDKEDLVLIGSMLPHHYYSSPTDSLADDWGFLKVIKFRNDFAGKSFFDLPEMEPVKKLLKDASYGVEFPLGTSRQVKDSICKLNTLIGPERIITLLNVLAILAESDYKQLSTISEQKMDSSLDDRINNVLRFIHGKIDQGEAISLNETADCINMTPQSFSRYFKKVTRKKFIEYINEIKIGKVCQLLLNTDKTIAEICFENGFNNLSNFNRQFAKYKKMTPKEYRHKYRSALTT